MTKTALITGITGQDGSYLAELLLDKDYIVWGIIRKASHFNTKNIEHLYDNKNLILRYGDLSDSTNLINILAEIKNKYSEIKRLEVYNLAAMSHVKVSFDYSKRANVYLVNSIKNLRFTLAKIKKTNLKKKITNSKLELV